MSRVESKSPQALTSLGWKKQGILISVLIFVVFSSSTYSQKVSSHSGNQEELEAILKKCEEYSEKVENASLHFVCIERVKEEISTSRLGRIVSATGSQISIRTYTSRPQWEKNQFVYDYQLIKQGDKITEKRILIEENGKKKYLDNALLKTKRFYSRWSALGPSRFFSKSWQEKFNYRLIKKSKYKGEHVYILEAIPKEDIEEKPNYGKVWVNKEDGSIMKIEIEMESLAGFDELKEKSEQEKLKPMFKVVHYYEYKKNGIHFPSKTIFEEDYIYIGKSRRRFKKSKTTFIYDNYKFFTVEWETKRLIKKLKLKSP